MRKINHHIKRYQKFDFDTHNYVLKYYIKNNKAVIPIQLDDKEELFSPYHPNKIILNPDIMEYIEYIVYYIPYQYTIVLEFSGVSFIEEEKIHINEVLSQYFGLRAHDKKADLRFLRNKAITLFIFGFLFLYASYLLFQHTEFKFINDVISIAGTFSIWELVNTLWLEKASIRMSHLSAGQLATATIEFKIG